MTSEASAIPDQKTILVVEDSDEIRELLGFVLEAEGYQVVALEDGRDVVETAREQQPVLITLDLALPGKDGWAIVRELQDDDKTRDILEISDGRITGFHCFLDTKRWFPLFDLPLRLETETDEVEQGA